MKCSVAACDSQSYRRGWCCAHYNRWKRNGHTDGRRVMYGEALQYFRDVVCQFDADDCLPWPYSRNTAGYGHVRSDGHLKMVHRMVCEAICGGAPTPEHQAAHSCGNGHLGCVSPRHLRWATAKENSDDKRLHAPRSVRVIEVHA